MTSRKKLFTVRHSTEAGARKIEQAREMIARMNEALRANGSSESFRLSLSPRKGRDNPNSWKYDNRFSNPARMRLEDADRVDVYLVPKRGRR
jgi:hypothetical protein